MEKLTPLTLGAEIGVVALGSPLSPARFEAAEKTARDCGFPLRYSLHPSKFYGKSCKGFANGSAAERLQAFDELLDNPDVGAVLTARGGYGILELLPQIDLKKVAKARKPIIGISDTTALLVQAGGKLGIPAIHGPTAGDSFADYHAMPAAKASVDALFALLSDPAYRYEASCTVARRLSPGQIVAGNLSMLTALLGTPWEPDLRNKILVLEEVGEAPYRIHRLFTQLRFADKFDGLAGLVLGRFSKCESPHGPSVEDVFGMLVDDILRESSFPVLAGLPFGHWEQIQALPLGCEAEIGGGVFSVIESPIA